MIEREVDEIEICQISMYVTRISKKPSIETPELEKLIIENIFAKIVEINDECSTEHDVGNFIIRVGTAEIIHGLVYNCHFQMKIASLSNLIEINN